MESTTNNRVSTWAIVSLIFGITSFVGLILLYFVGILFNKEFLIDFAFLIFGISAIIALITGIMALIRIKTKRFREKGYAIIGILLGLIEILLLAGFLRSMFTPLL